MATTCTEKTIDTGKHSIPVKLQLPASGKGSDICVIVTHGASGDMDSGNLPRIAEGLAGHGIPVARFTYKSSSLPARVKVFQAVLAAARTWPETQSVKHWVLSGHSMGARAAVSTAAEAGDGDGVAGCLLMSYPVHPPGKPEDVRDEPLTSLQLPLMFVRGTNDPFSTQDPWDKLRPRLTTKHLLVKDVEGGDHSLHVSAKASKGQPKPDILGGVVEAVAAWCTDIKQHSASAGAGPSGDKPTPKKQQTQAGKRKAGSKGTGGASQEQQKQAAGKGQQEGKKRAKAEEVVEEEEEEEGDEEEEEEVVVSSPKDKKRSKKQEGAGKVSPAGPGGKIGGAKAGKKGSKGKAGSK